MADKPPSPDNPEKWEKAVSAAYLRSLNRSQEIAAKAAGIGERTLRRWEHSEWWPRAVWEAHQRWLSGIVCGAKAAIVDGLEDPDESAVMGRWVGERMIPELSPPRQRHENTGRDGGPIEIKATGTDLKKLTDDELTNLKQLAAKITSDD